MRVLMVGNCWNTAGGGGLDRYLVDLADSLAGAGVSPTVLVNEVGAHPEPYVQGFGRPNASLPARWLAARRTAQPYFRSGSVSLANFHFAPYAFPLLSLIPREVPVVTHFHGPWADESQVEEVTQLRSALKFRMRRFIERKVYDRSHRFITLSGAFRELLHRDYGVPLERIMVIPGAVDTRRFRPLIHRAEARQRLGWPADRPMLLSVRRLVRRMGLENLIDAMDLVRRRCPDALLLIGGKGPLEGALRQRIAERNLDKHVQLIGFLPNEELPVAYRAANLSVVPTVALEGFGLILAESLACGTPCLGTPVGGIPEVLAPLDRNLLFESAEPRALADRIVAVLNGRVPVPTDQACRAFALERFSWAAVTDAVLRVFHETQGGLGSAARAVP